MNDPTDIKTPDPAASEQFIRLFADHHHRILGYILALVPDEHHAEEIFQDVSVVLWQKCGDFDPAVPGSNFMAWAKSIALNHIRNYRRIRSRDRLVFSDEMTEQLAEDHDAMEGEAVEAHRALSGCMAKLRDTDRDLIDRCYSDKERSFKQIAEDLGRSPNTVYKALIRIRRALHDCVETTLAAERRR